MCHYGKRHYATHLQRGGGALCGYSWKNSAPSGLLGTQTLWDKVVSTYLIILIINVEAFTKVAENLWTVLLKFKVTRQVFPAGI